VSQLKLQLPSYRDERSPNNPRNGSARASRTHPENIILDYPAPAGSTKTIITAATAFKSECMEENSLELHGEGQFVGMLRLALIPAFAGTRDAQHDKPEIFRQTETRR